MKCAICSVVWFAAAYAGAPSFGQNPAGERPDFEVVDRASIVVGVIEIGASWRAEEAELERLAAAHPFIMLSEPAAAAKKLGFSLGEVDRAFMMAGNNMPFFALTFSDAATLAKFRNAKFPDAEASETDPKTLVGGKGDAAGYLWSDRTIVVGSPKDIERVAKPSPSDKPVEALRSFQAVARGRPLLAAQVDAAVMPPPLKRSFEENGMAPLLEARSWRIVGMTTDAGLKISITAEFDDEARAAGSLEAMRSLQTTMLGFLRLAAVEMPKALERDAEKYPEGPTITPVFESCLKRTALALEKSSPTVAAGTLSLECTLETKTPVADAVCLLSLSPRGEKAPAKP